MFKNFRSLMSSGSKRVAPEIAGLDFVRPPSEVSIEGVPSFSILRRLTDSNGFPILDWTAVEEGIGEIDDDELIAVA